MFHLFMRHKILLQTDFPLIKSGLGENGRILAKYLDQTGKYDIVYYGSQAYDNHGDIPKLPYRAIGAIPSNPAERSRLEKDWFAWRDTCYGSHHLHKIIEQEKPTIWWGSNDIWAFQPHVYTSNWFQKINSVLHITVDSLPISPMAFDQASKTPHYFTWAKFAQKEMVARGAKNVQQIYGACETSKFKPISETEKKKLREKYSIDPNTTIFIYLGRNQLRKEFGNVISAFSEFKKENPNANAKLFFHTSYGEHQMGWDIPKIMDFYKVKNEDVLTTMYCRQCREWEVRPFTGENTDCRFCGTKKSQITCTIAHGVDHDELHQVYGIADAAISPFTSGGLEFHNVNSLLCGLPLACTNYSCGEDFCEQPFVYPIKWHTRFEAQTTYLKATNDVNSIKNFMSIIYRKSTAQRREEGLIGREWAQKTFSIETIGPQWEKLFDAMPHPDWSSIELKPKPKNPDFPMPVTEDNTAWLKELYKGFFDLNVQDDDKGLKDWLAAIGSGRTRKSIYDYFVYKAREENDKNSPPKPFGDFFDKNDKKKVLVTMKESMGDLFILTAELEGLKKKHPDSEIYIACEPRFAEVFDGNPHVHRVIPWFPETEMELHMIRYVDHFYYPAVATQKWLNYLSQPTPTLKLYETS